MPATRALLVLTLMLALLTVALPYATEVSSKTEYRFPAIASSVATRALDWLSTNQFSNGSYGPYTEVGTAPAAYGLWLNSSLSSKARTAYTWLASEFDDGTNGIWYEADLPGEILHTLSKSDNLGLLADGPSDYDRLMALQRPEGGFQGFYDLSSRQTVASSVDTAMALWGLINARAISSQKQQSAISYLLNLQNVDGSFNLTSTLPSHALYSLGPEPISITALVTLVLKESSSTGNDLPVAKALNYLSQSASVNFTGHVYAAALSALAFNVFGHTADASRAVAFLVENQNPDGSFKDKIRSQTSSPALDTGWAAIALQSVQTEPVPTGQPRGSPSLRPLVLAEIVASVVVPVAVLLGVAVYYLQRKRESPLTIQ